MAEKNYQVLRVIVPEAEKDNSNMKLSGLTTMGRTEFPTSENLWQVRQSHYPKPATISNNVPVICTDEALINALEIPAFLAYGAIMRETKRTSLGAVHTGKVATTKTLGKQFSRFEIGKMYFVERKLGIVEYI